MSPTKVGKGLVFTVIVLIRCFALIHTATCWVSSKQVRNSKTDTLIIRGLIQHVVHSL